MEIERARLTRTLAKIKEEEGNVTEAANILQELQVETFGSMDKKEKVEFILEQMRLCLAKKDFVRTQIISKKISTKYFADETTQVCVSFFKVRLWLRFVYRSLKYFPDETTQVRVSLFKVLLERNDPGLCLVL